jgi:TetR/AcrR family transcriptional regulator, cholesterol catabolism regulator
MTRDDILEAAAQVFREKGYNGASMADIAGVLNLQKASLYHHISSKQEILLALLDRALEMLTDQISPITEQPLPADQKLRLMIGVYLKTLAGNADLSSVLLFEHRSLDRKSHIRHIPNRDRFENLWRKVINEGVNSKLFLCQDIGLSVRGLMGTLNWTLTWYRPDGDLSIEKIGNLYADMLFNGLLVK